MPSRLWFCNCSVILLAALRLIKGNESCLKSKVSSDPIIIDKRSEVNFTFTISNKCESDLNVVKVLIKTENSPPTTLCVLLHENNACIPSKGCTCNRQTGEYSVTNRIGISALDLEIIAELQDNRVFTKSVGILREQYPPSIESISVHTKGKYVDGPVPQNSSVTIICTWNMGYPLSTSRPRLRDQQGKELEVSHTPQNNEIQHNMDNVQCGDAGEIVCETQDGKSSMNKTLLVKCAPEFTVAKKAFFEAALSDSLHLRFPVRSHSTYITECELSKNTPSGRLILNSFRSSERSFSLKGTPPNLMLHFDIINVTTQFNGDYTIRLANDAGFGNSLTFMVNVVNTFGEEVETTVRSSDIQNVISDVTTNQVTTGDISTVTNMITPWKLQFFTLLGAVGFVVVLALCIALGIFIKRRGVTSRYLPPPTPHTFRRRAPDAVMFHVQPEGQGHRDSLLSVHDHIYTEIPDEEDATPSNNTMASSDSSTMSDSTFSNEHLAAISFPSSDNSDNDDDLHSNTSVVAVSAHSVTVHSWPSAALTTIMTRSEPPYENMTPTLPEPDNIPPSVDTSPVSNSTLSNDQHASEFVTPSALREPDEHLHLKPSPVETTTDSITGDSLPSAVTLRSEPPYENTMSTMPEPVINLHSMEASPASDGFFSSNQPAAVEFPLSNIRVPDNHLYPVTSAAKANTDTVTVRSSHPALTMTTSPMSEPQYENSMPIPRENDNDYLHPIASAEESAIPTFACKSTGLSSMNSCTASKCEGTLYENTVTLSKKTSNTLPDDYLHPIASPLEAITTVSTTVAVTSETVSTTKTQDKQSCTTEEQK